ncbi:flagellar protein FlaG [Vibrio genomosp. F10]|uniref:flagellar protein FlaG n=1 Tax=Vibrio genomosp. F10 TaxID=723171 RepID=UPI0002E57F57|nr:flagellar protein FlaG [Vibrio genomosp. F10]OEE88794.1 flagellar biosynthesis protein FlaG [Vibrio genomosp. F10 str. 9ZD137]
MDISSNASIIQPYGSNGGIKLASENNGAPNVSYRKESNSASQVNQNHVKSVEATIELVKQREQLNKQEREAMVEQMNDFISSINTGLSFRVDEQSGRDVVTIYEASTGDIIRQIPEEEMLEVLGRLRDQAARYSSGLVIDKV